MEQIKGQLAVKTFDELTAGEIYEILKARAAVFVKEQRIIYVDEDDVDYESLHCFYMQDGRVTAYLRVYDVKKDSVKIGRVLTIEHGRGTGSAFMKEVMEAIAERYSGKRICMDAQKRAVRFYERLGFKVTSDEYLEEGVVHVDMEKAAGED